MDCQTAIVTGANSGVGLALCERLLSEYPKVKLCLVCRNRQRGEIAKDALLLSHPGAAVFLVICDIGSIESVRKCAPEIKMMFNHIDFLFLNAGMMSNPKINYGVALATLFQPKKLVQRFTTGADLLQIDDSTTREGFKATFATNVLGHFCMVQELDEVLGGAEPSRIVWTSSKMANKEEFSVADIQHNSGVNSYAASKYLMDSLSVVMNEKMRSRSVSVNTLCPGLVQTGMSGGMLPWWVWYLMVPLIKLLRLFVPSNTWEPYNGAEAMMWLTRQNPRTLDPLDKYYSMCSVFGNAYTAKHKMNINMADAEDSYSQLKEILANFKS